MKDLDVFLQIVREPVPYTDSAEEDEDACERLLKEFGDAEVDEIACVSYAYWIVRSNMEESLPDNSKRLSALKEIRRHYVGEGRSYSTALAAIREALEYRRAYHVNALRSCFYDTDNGESGDSDLAQKYKRFVVEDLERQPMVVRGVDDNGRVIIYKPPRTSPGDTADDDEAFLLTQLYTAERAMATCEFTSRGKEETLTVVFNFQDYSRKNTPPSSVIIKLLQMIQRCYPERLQFLIIVNPPFWLRGVYNLAYPFLSQATVEKLSLPSGKAAADKAFQQIVSGNKELEAMLATGEISSVDLTDYTQQPFYRLFEENKQ
mmetsp:Transcript_19082/g.47431  ORF Transcript_19082/g.47431 Transcript_19082/m.47431 type:complete len:319 (-) Transcript_19082:3261-4217(-)